MGCKKSKGFTFIEAMMVIVIIGVIAASGAYVMLYVVQNSVFIPNKLNVEMVGQDLLDIMLEGDPSCKGLRLSNAITTASANTVGFINTTGQTVEFLWDGVAKRINRRINGASWLVVPNYLPNTIYIDRKGTSPIFTYYDANQAETTTPANVRRIKVEFKVTSGSGAYADWQGQAEFSSSITVRKFQ
jgi:prepilin-type N-terminal cleavage/methylation domain-containing protein